MKGYSLNDIKELVFMPLSYWKGINLMKSKEWGTAIDELKKALSVQPNNSFINFKLGFCYMKLEEWELSHRYLKKAVSNNKNRVIWQKQYYHVENELIKNPKITKNKQQSTTKVKSKAVKAQSKVVENKLETPKVGVKKSEKMNSGEAVDLAKFQIAMLKCDYEKQDEFLFFMKQVFSDKSYTTALCNREYFLNKILIYYESIISDTKYNSAMIEDYLDISIDRNNKSGDFLFFKYLQASYLYRVAKYSEALEILLSLIAQYPKKYVMHYLLAVSSAINLSKYELAYDLAIEVSQFSRRALIWKYRHVTSSLMNQWTDIYRSYLLETKEGRLSLGNFQVLNNVIDTLINVKEYDLALGLLRKSADFVSEHPNPSKLIKKTLKFPTDNFVPEWSIPLVNLDRQEIVSDLTRFKKVLFDSYKLLKQHDIEVIVKSNSFNMIFKKDNGEATSSFFKNIELGVLSSDTLGQVEAIIRESGLYVFSGTKHDGQVLYFKHRLGITIEVTLYKINTFEKVTFYQDGALTICESTFETQEHIYDELSLTVLDNDSLNIIHKGYVNEKEEVIQTYIAFIDAIIRGDEVFALKLKAKLRVIDQSHPFEIVQEEVGCEIQSLEYLDDYRPEVVLYLSGLENVAYQGNMWLSVLDKLPCRVAIVIREARIAGGLEKTDIPVFLMRNMRELELLESFGVKTILYPANTQKNIQTLRFFKLNHFFINHGESDKVVNQSKFLMAYDKLLVAGPLAEKRLYDAGLPVRDGQVVHVGRPQVELLLEQITEPIKKVKTILYAPTWEGFVEEANYSSVSEFGMQMLQQLVDEDTKIYFKPHPYTGHNKNGDTGEYLEKIIRFAKSNGIEIVDSREPIFDYMNMCDLLITDVSSVLNDFLYTKKPMLLTNPKNIVTDELHLSFPSSPATYNLNDPHQVSILIESIEENDYLWKVRQGILKESLGDIPEGYLERFKTIVMESLY